MSGKAVEKRCKKYGIQKPPRGYWMKKRAEEKTGLIYINPEEALPSKEELKKLVWEKPISRLAKELNVNHKYLSKYCKDNKILLPPIGYWS